MASKKWWFLGLGAAALAVIMVVLAGALLWRFVPEIRAYSPLGKKIAVLEVEGSIESSEGLIEIIHDYRDDPAVAAVVVYVDSPGGLAAPTQEIYAELLKLKEKDKKVYAYISTLGASGGYYLACAGDKIYASPGALTGSIGVIMTFTNVEGLFGKVGLSTKTIKSGRYKDIGSPFRPMTPEEEALLGETVDDVYQQFLDAVTEGRRAAITAKLKAAGEKSPTRYRVRRYVMEYADGRIFTGRQAYELGFVDELGNFQACLKNVAEEVGIKGEPAVVRKELRKTSAWGGLFSRLTEGLLGFPEPAPRLELKYSLF
jgi:protease-4